LALQKDVKNKRMFDIIAKTPNDIYSPPASETEKIRFFHGISFLCELKYVSPILQKQQKIHQKHNFFRTPAKTNIILRCSWKRKSNV